MERVRAFVRSVARRLGTQGLLEAGGTWLSVGVGAAAALLAAERLVSLGANAGLLATVPIAAACLAGVAAGLARWPATHAAALAADAQLGLQERLSSALAAGKGPMADMVRADAERRVAALDPRREFPVRVPERFRWLALCAVGLAVAALVPPLDVFGWGAARAARRAEQAAVRRATDGARVGLGKLAGVGREQGLDRATQAIAQIDRALDNLAATEPTAAKARDVARKVAEDLQRAKAASEDALGRAADAKERDKAEGERDLFVSTQRLLEDWERELAGGAPSGLRPVPGKAPDDKKGEEAAPSRAPEFVRAQEAPPAPRETAKVESRLLATRPAAEAATRRDDIPWQYRPLVRRYFSPGNGE
ncbi:MAG TPA: hypothetical protein VNE39_27440 [Planctomycetota bacterium]|nr:hypothetical protein [Planctomycetota bacterium]